MQNSIVVQVTPPKLEGKRVGVFATRAPHRPNPIGLTVCRVERIESTQIVLAGVDLVHGTPVITLEPYVCANHGVWHYDLRVPQWLPPVHDHTHIHTHTHTHTHAIPYA
eukprot:GHVR01016753.1.p1 GENE.GHVR01016753.1~~GHVR01016753.1.p1  ORF type:complete len:109 (+),score=42.90 GHVR01016753.1:212-538(+)